MSEVKETMEDFASELEASYKNMTHAATTRTRIRKARTQRSGAELAQQMEDKTVLKVKVKRGSQGRPGCLCR